MGTTEPTPLPVDAERLTGLHGPGCVVCGPGGPGGDGMEVYRVGDGVVGEVTFGHAAAHGAVHGGVVALVCDDLFSYLVIIDGDLAVTRTLEVGYRRPVRVGSPYWITARVEAREGRRLRMVATGATAEGEVAFTAGAVFVRVDPSHLDRSRTPVPETGARGPEADAPAPDDLVR